MNVYVLGYTRSFRGSSGVNGNGETVTRDSMIVDVIVAEDQESAVKEFASRTGTKYLDMISNGYMCRRLHESQAARLVLGILNPTMREIERRAAEDSDKTEGLAT